MTRTMTWTSRAAPPFPRRPSRPRSRPPPPPRLPRLRHPSMFSQSFLRGVATPPRGRATRLAPRPAWPSARRRPRARLRRGSNPRPQSRERDPLDASPRTPRGGAPLATPRIRPGACAPDTSSPPPVSPPPSATRPRTPRAAGTGRVGAARRGSRVGRVWSPWRGRREAIARRRRRSSRPRVPTFRPRSRRRSSRTVWRARPTGTTPSGGAAPRTGGRLRRRPRPNPPGR
mmetsp:Transcript_3223/g.14422  ORF Transcript_3223/g.14422 Transcript_3223/m.14422 type:complete len:230 (-) Transcript_3223:220-909(-)